MPADGLPGVWAATRVSVDRAVSAGTLDPTLSAGPIAAVLLVAEQLDHPDFPVIDGRLDNVSLPTYLRYCQALGLVPAVETSGKEAKGGSKLAELRSIEGARVKEAAGRG